MFRGFYTVTSSMLTESRKLDVTSNNLANMGTAGFKADQLVATNFGDEMVAIMSNNRLDAIEEIGSFGTILVPGENKVSFEQGNIDTTDVVTDFAILGDGFFVVENPVTEEMIYTRSGSFALTDLGFLNLQGSGMVQGESGQPIQVTNDRFTVDGQGNVFDDQGVFIDKIAVVDFAEYDDLIKVGEGLFQSAEEPENSENFGIIWKAVESSNVDAAAEMMSMMVSQRSIQSASQILSIYDQLSSKASNDLGKV